MALNLNSLQRSTSSGKRKKRVGRGNASGHGTFSTRGQKGQRARSGGRSGLRLKGIKRIMENIPKQRGFKSRHAKPQIVNLYDLNQFFTDGERVTPEVLLQKGLVDNIDNGVKILGEGELQKKLFIAGCELSSGAKEKILKSQGQII